MPQGSPRGNAKEAGVGNVGNTEKSHRVLVALGLVVCHRFRSRAKSEGSRTSRLTASSAAAGRAPAGNCNTVAR